MQQSTTNPFFPSVSASSGLNNNNTPNNNNLFKNIATPKIASTQSNNECPPHGFLAANQPTLQYYLTPSPKCMAPTSNNNVSSVFQGMPEKHRLLHKTSKSLGINQKNQQQQHNINTNNTTSELSQSPLILDVPQSNKDPTAFQLRINHHCQVQTDPQNILKKDKSSSSLNPKTSSYDLNLSQNQHNFNINLNCATFDQQNKPVPVSFERSKSTCQLKLPQQDNSSLNQYYGQENLLPNASSLQHSSFFTLPQSKELYQQLSQLNNQETHQELKESYSRLPLTPIQRLQEKQKMTKNQVSSFLPSSGLNIDYQQQLLLDSQSILSVSSKQPECLINSSSNSNPFNSNSNSFQFSNNKPSLNPMSVGTFNKEVLINQQSNSNKFPHDELTLENPVNNYSSSNNYVKLNSFLSNNTNHIRNKSTSDKSSTTTTLLKLVSPRGAFNIGASTAYTEEATTAMETLPSTYCLQSPRRQTLSLWAERCHTTESDYYQQNQKCFLDAKTEESMIDGTVVGLERIQIGEQLNKTANAVRSITCSEMIKKSTSDYIISQLSQQQDPAQQINRLKEEMEQVKQMNITQNQQEKSTQSANQELKKQIEQLSTNLLYMENRLKEIEAENSSLKKENECLQNNQDHSKQEIAQYNDRIQFLEQINSSYQKDISDFKQLIHQEVPHTNKDDANKINNLSQLLDQTNAKIQLLQQQLEDKEQICRESSNKVIELQDKMVFMSEKARQAAEKASEASSRLVAASEDAQRLREQLSQLETQNSQLQNDIEQFASKASANEDNQIQIDHWKNAFESLAQPVSLFLREFSKNVLSYSKNQEKQHTSSLAKDLLVFSEGLRALLEEQIKKKYQLDEKNTIINEQAQFVKQLERQIEQLKSQITKQDDEDDQNKNKELAILRNKDKAEIEDQSQSQELLLNDQKHQYHHQQNQQQLLELSQEQQLMSIPKKVTEYIQQEQRLFEQKFRERMADVEQEMFKQMHEKDQKITKLNSDNNRLTELNEQRLVEQKILQAHLDRKQEETIRSAKAIEELQKRLESNPVSRINTAQLGKQSSKASEIVSKDRRLQIDSIREEEENEHSIDEEEEPNDLETLNNKASFEFQEKQQKQLANEQSQQNYETQSFQHQHDGLLVDFTNQQTMEWKSKLDEKRKIISRLRRELEKCNEKLIDLQEREFSQESLNRRLTAELETVKASSQDVPKLIEMLKSRKLEYTELKKRFDSMKHERDQAIRILNKPQMEQFNQSTSSLYRQKNRNFSLNNNNNHSLLIQQNLNDSLFSNRRSEPNDSNFSNQRQLIQYQRQFYQQQQQQQKSNRAHSLSAERSQNLNNLFQAD